MRRIFWTATVQMDTFGVPYQYFDCMDLRLGGYDVMSYGLWAGIYDGTYGYGWI